VREELRVSSLLLEGESIVSANARIVARLTALADHLELGMARPREVCDTLLGHTEAVERVPYSMVKDAQVVHAQLSQAINAGRENDINVHALGDWLRKWASQVPCEPA
jgi:hypothetical protein